MSQRKFTHQNKEVLVGWDRPLQYFFLLVEQTDAPDDDPNDGYLFNNLKRKNPGMTLDEIGTELANLGIPHPPTLFTDLAADRQTDNGNGFHDYGAT